MYWLKFSFTQNERYIIYISYSLNIDTTNILPYHMKPYFQPRLANCMDMGMHLVCFSKLLTWNFDFKPCALLACILIFKGHHCVDAPRVWRLILVPVGNFLAYKTKNTQHFTILFMPVNACKARHPVRSASRIEKKIYRNDHFVSC